MYDIDSPAVQVRLIHFICSVMSLGFLIHVACHWMADFVKGPGVVYCKMPICVCTEQGSEFEKRCLVHIWNACDVLAQQP